MSYPLGSIPFSGIVGTSASTDTYPVTTQELNVGSHRSVADITTMQAISTARRAFGMLVTVQNTNPPTTYVLCDISMGGNSNTLSDNLNWLLFTSGGGVTSVANSDGTLTITPTTGAVVASLALGHANTWTATQTLTPASASLKPLIVQGYASQTANLQEWQNSSATALAYVDASGNSYFNSVNVAAYPSNGYSLNGVSALSTRYGITYLNNVGNGVSIGNGFFLGSSGANLTGLTTTIGGTSTSNSRVTIIAGLGASAWGTSGIGLVTASGSYQDNSTAAGSTVSTNMVHVLNAPTLAALNATSGSKVTYTTASTLYIAGAPAAGTNVNITNPYALHVLGETYIDVSSLSTSVTGLYVKQSSNGSAAAVLYNDGGATNNYTLISTGNAGYATYFRQSGQVGFGASGPVSQLQFGTGLQSSTATVWGSSGIGINWAALTYTDSNSAGGTISQVNLHSFGAPTFSNSNAITYTNAATVYIAGAPIAGGSGPSTITNAYSLQVASGQTLLTGSSLSGSQAYGTLLLNQVWNTTGAPTAFSVAVTNTASSSSSKLFDFKNGSTSLFSMTIGGNMTAGSGSLGGYLLTVNGSGGTPSVLSLGNGQWGNVVNGSASSFFTISTTTTSALTYSGGFRNNGNTTLGGGITVIDTSTTPFSFSATVNSSATTGRLYNYGHQSQSYPYSSSNNTILTNSYWYTSGTGSSWGSVETNRFGSILLDNTNGGSTSVLTKSGFVWYTTASTTLAETMRLSGLYLGVGVTSPTAYVHPAASTTAAASYQIPSGTAPASPNNGDLWYDGTHLYFRKSTTNIDLLGSGFGTVTSVGLSLPGIFTVSGSPVTSSGTLSASLNTQSANYVFSGPASGSAAAPTFRALVAADIPSLSGIYLTSITGNNGITVSTVSGAVTLGLGAITPTSLQTNTIYYPAGLGGHVAINFTSYLINSPDGNTFIDLSNRRIKNDSGNIVADFTSLNLNNSSGQLEVDFQNNGLYAAGNQMVDWGNGYTFDTSGNVSIQWSDYITNSNDDQTTIDWQNLYLYPTDGTGNPSVSWGAHTLNVSTESSPYTTVDWGNCYLQTKYSIKTADWGNQYLYYNDAVSVSVDWQNGYLYSVKQTTNPGTVSVDYYNCYLYDQVNGYLSVDFNGRQMYYTNGTTVVATWGSTLLSDYTSGNSSVDWTNRLLYDSSGSDSVGYGSRALFDSSGSNISVDWSNRKLYGTSYPTYPTVDYESCLFNDGINAVASIDASNRYLYYLDGTTVSLNWYYGATFDRSGNLSLSWLSRDCFDSSNTISIDYENRLLHDSTGTYGGGIDWQNKYLINYYSGSQINVFEWAAGYLNHPNTGSLAVNLNTYELYDQYNNQAVDWNNKLLYNNSATAVINFNNRWYVEFNSVHLRFTQGVAPTIAAQSAAGTGATASLVSAVDTAGTIQLNSGSGSLSTGAVAVITMYGTFTHAPRVVICPNNAVTAAAMYTSQIYVDATATTFTIHVGAALTASTSYVFTYILVEV